MAIGVAIAALATLLVMGGGSGASSTPTNKPTGSASANKVRLYAQLEALPMLDEDQRLTLILIAQGETSGTYSPNAHNDSDSEVDASRRAWKNVAERFADCGRPADEYIIGSIGRFQRLAPYFANDLRHVIPCVDPQLGFDGLHDIVSAISYAAWITRLASWNGRVSGLRGGWATPEWVDGPPADKLAKWRGHAEDAGLGGAFLDRKIKRFPDDLGAVLAALQAFDAQTVS